MDSLIDPADLPSHGQFNDSECEVHLYEFKADPNRYLATHSARAQSLADIIAFNEDHRSEEMSYFEQEIIELKLAYAFEQPTKVRHAPSFLSSVDSWTE